MQLFEVQMDAVGKYIVKNAVKVSGLKIFVRSACTGEEDCQNLTTHCFIASFLDLQAMFSYGLWL